MTYRPIAFDFQSIDESLENFLKDVPRNLVLYLKQSFERYLPTIMKGAVKLESMLVIDSSSVIANLIAFVKTGDSLLNKIIADPFLQLHAPPNLEREVEKGIEKVSKKLKLDIELLRKNWCENILPLIIIDSTSNSTAISQGYSLVGNRDESDVPFVALNFQLGAQGIITRDKDMIEQPVIRTWRLLGVKDVITVFRKGSFSFFIFSQALPSILKVIFNIGIAILRVMLEILCNIIQSFSQLVTSGIESLSKLPDWFKILLTLAGITIAVIVALNEDAREFIAKNVRKIGEALSRFATDVQKIIKEMLEKIAPLVQTSLTTLSCLYTNYQKTIEQLNSLPTSVQ